MKNKIKMRTQRNGERMRIRKKKRNGSEAEEQER